jgi:hypothetical protein
MERKTVAFGKYTVCSDGVVLGQKGEILKLATTQDGYVILNTYDHCKQMSYRLHRLIAKLYIPNPNNYPQVNHKDGDKLNNRVENLEWCTQSHNIRHAFDTGLMKSSRGVFREEEVRKIRCRLREGESARSIAISVGVSPTSILGIKNGKSYKGVGISPTL